MDSYFAELVEHLNGLIFMARVAWREQQEPWDVGSLGR
jgi:hypothetical protein